MIFAFGKLAAFALSVALGCIWGLAHSFWGVQGKGNWESFSGVDCIYAVSYRQLPEVKPSWSIYLLYDSKCEYIYIYSYYSENISTFSNYILSISHYVLLMYAYLYIYTHVCMYLC